MNTYYKQTLLLLMIFLGQQFIYAQESVSKQVTENHSFTDKGELTLHNKYGDVVINGWEKESIAISVDIIVTHKKLENAKELLNRIQPELKVVGDLVTITTEIKAKNENVISNFFNKSNPLDYDKTNVQINYTIYVPSTTSLDITNKFGDIILENIGGRLIADIQHGDIWINQDITNATVDLKYGNLKAKSISYGSITLKNAELNMSNGQKIELTSSGSDIQIVDVTNLEIKSNKDKINISSIGEIKGTLAFSEMEVKTLEDEITLNLKVADFKLLKINNPGAFIHLEQQSSDININISGLSFKFNANLEQGVLRIPKSFQNVKSHMISEEQKIREINATYGDNPTGKISLKGKKGNITLTEIL